jgi:hypothetical protein
MTRSEWVNAADRLMYKLYGVSIFDYLGLDYMDDLCRSGCDPESVVYNVAKENSLKRKNP